MIEKKFIVQCVQINKKGVITFLGIIDPDKQSGDIPSAELQLKESFIELVKTLQEDGVNVLIETSKGENVNIVGDYLRTDADEVEEDNLINISSCGLEGGRLTYNDVYKMAKLCGATDEQSTMISEMVRAVTNDSRGRNRDERMPDYIYEEIKTIFYSLFVKLCDRLANVNYGLITGGSMPDKYKKENSHFKGKLYTPGLYEEMWNELELVFEKIN